MAETEWSTIEAGSPPEQEKVEFEIEGQEATEEAAAPEVEVETQEKVETEAPQEEPIPTIEEEQEQETKGIETSGAQKRIRQLVKQKKEREAQIESLLAQQKEMQTKLQQREEEYKSLLNNNVESNLSFAEEMAIKYGIASRKFHGNLEAQLVHFAFGN